MPCYGISIAEAVARKQAIKWYTGLLLRPYLPWTLEQNQSLPTGLAAPGEDSASSSKCLYVHIYIRCPSDVQQSVCWGVTI